MPRDAGPYIYFWCPKMLLKNSKPKQPTIFGPTIFAYFAVLLLPTTSRPTKKLTIGSKQRNRWTLAHRRAIDVQTSTGLQVDLGCTFTGAFQCVFTVCTTIEGQRCVNQVVKGSWRGDDTMSAGVEGQLGTVAAVAQAIHVAWGARKGNKKRAVAGIHICHMS